MAVQTGAGNVTTASGTAVTLAVTLPANLVVGDILVCLAHNKTGPGTVTFDKGSWSTAVQNTGTSNNRSGGIYYIVITTASLAALGTPGSGVVTLTMGSGTSRRVAAFVRLTGRDTTTPLDAAGADYVQATASATAVLPAISATKTGSDIVALVFDNESGNVAASGSGTNGLTQFTNPTLYDGASSSTLMGLYQNNATTASSSTGTRSVTISPTPAVVAGGAMVAFAPAPAVTTVTLGVNAKISAAGSGPIPVSVSLGMTLRITAGIRVSQPGQYSFSTILRNFLMNKLDMTQAQGAVLSTNDLLMRYYSQQTSLTGPLSYLQSQWLKVRGYSTMQAYLKNLGYTGNLSNMLLNYYSDLPPMAGGGSPFDLLDFGGADFGLADFGVP
jgi:hypothetical protein